MLATLARDLELETLTVEQLSLIPRKTERLVTNSLPKPRPL
jgi:hypothetical protein